MMQSEEDTLTMPITVKAHHQAQQFWQQQPNTHTAQQVYLNTLAVQAVQSYLSWFGIATDLEASDSWNPAMQSLANTADLVVRGVGKLECRPVLPDADICEIPPEVCCDRIGYVAVQFNSELSEATLLGFVPAVATTQLPLQQLQPLDALLDYLQSYLQPAFVSVVPDSAFPARTTLSQWLQGLVQTGWQTVEDLLLQNMLNQQPVWSFRTSSQTPTSELPMTRAKVLKFRSPVEATSIALIVGLLPAEATVMDVWVKLCPTGNQMHLPAELDLMVLDDTGMVVMQAQSRETEMIQLKFKAMMGELFSVKVALGIDAVTENFVV